jgi:hypothetical protein
LDKKFFFMCGTVFLICFAVIFSVDNFNGFVLGDYIFYKIGIPFYSNGYDGLHYTVFVTLILLFIGLIELRILMLERKIKTSRIILVFFIISLMYRPVYMFTYSKIKEFSDGLNSITYLRKDSKLIIKVENNNRTVEGSFKFHNYSSTEKRYFISVLRSNKEEKINPYMNIENSINFSETKNEVIIPPKSEKIVNLNKKLISNSSNPTYLMSTNLDICIYDKKNKIEFIKNKYR